MGPEGMTLAHALASAGGLDAVNADVNQVRVYRGGYGSPSVFTISQEEAYRFGESIHLFPGDRIYVAPSQGANYARSLQLLTPLLTTALTVATTALAIDAAGN
jgi:protein involved in polysaccharide export with SLBB domain